MHLDPAIRQFVDANSGELMAHLDVPAQRHYMRLLTDLNFLRFSRPGPAVFSITEHLVPVDGGHIRCRIYRPGDDDHLPAHLTLHGGGWWQGSIDDLICDAIARQRCAEAHVVVAAVDYRLAPEHPFPVPLDDAYHAYRWLLREAARLRIDPRNISIGGSSAGGNLAAALAIRLRNEAAPMPILQLLEVPALDLTLATSQQPAAIDAAGSMADQVGQAIERYLPDPQSAKLPHASPLLAPDLSGLPSAVILTAEHDPLRPEAELYAARLADADVPVQLISHPGALHGTAMLTRTWEPAGQWQRQAANALLAHWDTVPASPAAPAEVPLLTIVGLF
jgi:acetyl esterase